MRKVIWLALFLLLLVPVAYQANTAVAKPDGLDPRPVHETSFWGESVQEKIVMAPAAPSIDRETRDTPGLMPAQASASAARREVATLTLHRNEVQVDRGGNAEVRVSRSKGGKSRMQLGLYPSAGSNLMVSGGLFKDGDFETTIKVEAPRNARTGTVAVLAEDGRHVLTVAVRQ